MARLERPNHWRPKLVDALRVYDTRLAAADAVAGVTVGLVALPLAMAFAISSGLSPQAGLYTAIVAGGIISLFGGSRLQIGGPTGAFVVIVAGIVAKHGVDGLFVCTMMAGALLVVLGATGMGSAVMLGAIESLMSAMVADRMSGDRHDSNMELVAQGLANIASPLVGGLPATGAIARTATNIRSGARTPVAGVVHALTLLVILLVAAPLARFVPLAVLAAILTVVSYDMGDWGEIRELLRLTKTDVAVWIVTFLLTVFADLTQAVAVGMVCAALLFIKRVADTTTVALVTDEYVQDGHAHSLQDKNIPAYVRIVRIHGPFLFGATDKLRPLFDRVHELPEIVILRLRNMTALDATGLLAIEELAGVLRASGRSLILCGARHQPAQLIARADFHRHVGDANICGKVTDALRRAREIHGVDRGEPTAAA